MNYPPTKYWSLGTLRKYDYLTISALGGVLWFNLLLESPAWQESARWGNIPPWLRGRGGAENLPVSQFPSPLNRCFPCSVQISQFLHISKTRLVAWYVGVRKRNPLTELRLGSLPLCTNRRARLTWPPTSLRSQSPRERAFSASN